MDLWIIPATIFDFLKIWVPTAIIAFILYKIFSPLRKRLAKDYNLSWLKSAAVINFAAIFLFILAVYLLFMIFGASVAPVRDPGLEYNLLDSGSFILVSALRIALVSVILTAVLLFFEMIASLVMDYASGTFSVKKSSKKQQQATLINQFVGIFATSAIFLVIFVTAFDWVPLGLFVFIFYGGMGQLPLLFII